MRPANVAQMRSWINTCLTLTGTVTAPGTGEPVWDPVKGEYVDPPPTVIYSGPCLIYSRSLEGRTADVGEATWQIDQYVVTFPAGTDVATGMTLTVDASPDEPDLVGWELSITDVPVEAWSVALQCLAQRVTR